MQKQYPNNPNEIEFKYIVWYRSVYHSKRVNKLAFKLTQTQTQMPRKV